jgi:hypothetical protein
MIDGTPFRVDVSSCLSAGEPAGPRGRCAMNRRFFSEDMLIFDPA